MKRRDLLIAGLGAWGLKGVGVRANLPEAVETTNVAAEQAQRLLFFDASLLAEQSEVQLVPPRLEKLGPIIAGDSPGDSAGANIDQSGSIIADDRGGYRIYYTGYTKGAPREGVCLAYSNDGRNWDKPRLGQVRIDGEDTNRILLPGLPDGARTVQPVVMRLDDGRWRMYFWAHADKPQPPMGRYLVAESRDGLQWKVLNLDNPCLRHPNDIGHWAWLEGAEARKQSGNITPEEFVQLRRIRSNDATTVYRNPDGYEMYSIWLLPNPPGSGRHIAYDNISNWLRVIHRRTSEDGLAWSNPELILTPDRLDAWDQQLYYLTQHRIHHWRIGFVGHYRVAEQTMDVEFTYSRDGRLWHRPMRSAWFPRGAPGSADSTMVYICGPFIDKGDYWLALYSGANYRHSFRHGPGDRFTVLGLKIPKYRLAGLQSTDHLAGRVRTQPFIPSAPKLLLDADIRGALRAELCNAFGFPLPGYTLAESLPITGDSSAHELRWQSAPMSDYQYEGVSLRLEWTDGTVYGLLAS